MKSYVITYTIIYYVLLYSTSKYTHALKSN
nr:MAG TPA: hypothetical protein [Herelleviridae sp.]DAT60778.1 MAG TPA: hypothetical protein [Bacteriophage sp.]